MTGTEQVRRKPGRPKKEPTSTPKKASRTRTKKTEPQTMVFETITEEPQEPQTMVLKKITEEAPPEDKRRKNGKPFSVWLQDEDIEALKLYCEVTRQPVTKVVTSALRIFLAENRPTEEEKAAYYAELDAVKDKVRFL